MITIDLNSFTYSYAVKLLADEGYIAQEGIEEDSDDFARTFLYPYSLYNSDGQLIDTIYYIEYCIEVEDTEYIDGRMTFEAQSCEWKRL